MKLLKMTGLLTICIIFPVTVWLRGAATIVQNYPQALSKTKTVQMEKFIARQMKLGKIPGMALVIVKDGREVYKRGFGFADIKKKRPVTSQTLFELGSTSKAFTALGILLLEEKGLLQINDPVKKYLPWFKMLMRQKLKDPTLEYLNRHIPWFYATQEVNLTIAQLLRHTSGIDPGSIADIPPSTRPDSLETAVRILMKKAIKPQLDYYPGERYSYATINYDILGLIIATVTGRSYEDFIKTEILKPLGMNHTVLFRSEAGKELAAGYKVGFLRPLEYHAPEYRGNTPAGYIITNADDMAVWLKIQLGAVQLAPLYQKIVAKSHNDDCDYSYGWNIYRINRGVKISHSGSNPNYSSHIEFRPEENIGIALLCNTNSGFAPGIVTGIFNIINGRGRIPERLYDMLINYDEIACLLIAAFVILIPLTVRFTVNRYQFNKRYLGIAGKNFSKFLVYCICLSGFILLFYFLPEIVFGYNWPFLAVWAPVSLIVALALVLIEMLVAGWYLFIVCFFKGKDRRIRIRVRDQFHLN